MKVHLLATFHHYRRHAHAVWKHLPDENRGRVYFGRTTQAKRIDPDDVVMVAGFDDIARTDAERIVYVEHGAGQTYSDGAYGPNYPGGEHPEKVVAYVCPSKRVAELWARPAIAVGCPALDESGIQHRRVCLGPLKRAHITFHFDARKVCPEARSAREHWIDDLHVLVQWLRNNEFEVSGGRHPKDPLAKAIWRNLQVPLIEDPDQALIGCALMVADNTSLLYEAAALGIPSLVLNAPWYRKDVHHGLRFWDAVPGPMYDDMSEIMQIGHPRTMILSSDVMDMRVEAARYAYGPRPYGTAGIRAAEWLMNILAEM